MFIYALFHVSAFEKFRFYSHAAKGKREKFHVFIHKVVQHISLAYVNKTCYLLFKNMKTFMLCCARRYETLGKKQIGFLASKKNDLIAENMYGCLIWS